MANILVVDDERPIRNLLKRILDDAGHVVHVAANAAEALALCRHGAYFDVVLSDVMMPEMDGHELARRIAAHWPRTAIILMAGFDPGCEMCPYVNRCRIIQKPFTLDHVLGVISETLGAPLPQQNRRLG